MAEIKRSWGKWMSVYLGPSAERWHPGTEEDLTHALKQGLLEENHYLDFKRELGSNKELARDLAQFAVDAGTVVVGVEEVDGKFLPAPVPTLGLAERIEQVARSLVDAPLAVRCQIIPTAADPAVGYVLVHVPASGQAPHMVDGIYYGRGDKTRVRLSDAEVTRLHAGRRISVEDAERLLDDIVTRDPVPHDQRRQAHFFAFAHPVSPRPEMALSLVDGPNWTHRFREVINAALAFAPFRERPFSPDLMHASQPARRPDGAAMSSYQLTPGRTLDPEVSSHSAEDVARQT